MSIRIELKNEKNTITLSGRIDGQTCKEFQDNLMPFITEGEPSIKIDCKKVDYISSSGLRVFILADKKAHRLNGAITIANLNDFCKDVFEISGLTHLFNFV